MKQVKNADILRALDSVNRQVVESVGKCLNKRDAEVLYAAIWLGAYKVFAALGLKDPAESAAQLKERCSRADTV